MAFSVTHDSSNDIKTGSVGEADHINQNFTDIEAELNAFPTDGTFADGGVSTTAKLADGIVTVAKLASGILDTDGTLAADSDVKIPSQKAVKTYNDAATSGLTDFSGAVAIFGDWTATDSLGAALAKNETYEAQTDGFVVTYTTQDQGLIGYQGSASANKIYIRQGYTNYSINTGLMMPVKKGWFWKVACVGTLTSLYWIPLGVGLCVKQ